MSRILYILLFISIATISYGQAREATILQLEKDRFKAMINKDSLFLSRAFADDLLYFHTNGMQDSKETLINNIMSGNLQYYSIDLQQADIRTHSQTAWIHGAAKIKVKNGKDTSMLELSIRYLDIYKRENGEWRLVAWQSARLN